jgi:hypothetical protein
MKFENGTVLASQGGSNTTNSSGFLLTAWGHGNVVVVRATIGFLSIAIVIGAIIVSIAAIVMCVPASSKRRVAHSCMLWLTASRGN